MATVSISSDNGFSSADHSGEITIQVDGVTVYRSNPEQVKTNRGSVSIGGSANGVVISTGSGNNISSAVVVSGGSVNGVVTGFNGGNITIGNVVGRNFTQTIVQSVTSRNKEDA